MSSYVAKYLLCTDVPNNIFWYLIFTAKRIPKLNELQNLITSNYAHCWKEIGIELTLSYATLEIIEANHPKVQQRCTDMLATWLQKDVNATWQKLLKAIDSPAVVRMLSPTSASDFNESKYMFVLFTIYATMTYNQVQLFRINYLADQSFTHVNNIWVNSLKTYSYIQ